MWILWTQTEIRRSIMLREVIISIIITIRYVWRVCDHSHDLTIDDCNQKWFLQFKPWPKINQGWIFFLEYEQVAKLLVDKSADVNACNENQLTPLHYAVRNGNFQDRLWWKNHHLFYFKWTFAIFNCIKTMFFISLGNMHIVRLLVEKGADMNARDNHGWTPFLIAESDGIYFKTVVQKLHLKINKRIELISVDLSTNNWIEGYKNMVDFFCRSQKYGGFVP